MREITTHHDGNMLNDAIKINPVGEPGSGGAHSRYDVLGYAEHIPNIGPRLFGANLRFQEGPVSKPEDMNGLTNEALLAVVIDRLECFQAGQYPCPENAVALLHCQAALEALKQRTAARIARGVEGTHKA